MRSRIAALADVFLRIYHRQEIEVSEIPSEPVLFVSNHGFGGVFDLNVIAFAAARHETGDQRPVIALTHQAAWQIGVGRFLEPFGARIGTKQTALEAFAKERHVLVFPGGDIDAFKSWGDRNKVMFAGRSGFARLAMDAGVPIVPVVTSGAGESVVVLDNGKWLAEKLGVYERFRLHRLPVSLSVPWGLNVGLVGLLPYIPLPTKIRTAILPALCPEPGESAEQFAERVHGIMQGELDRQTQNRIPVIGPRRDLLSRHSRAENHQPRN